MVREQQPFTNPCRTDGLVLRHWRQKTGPRPTTPGGPATPAEPKSEGLKTAVRAEEQNYHWAKYNTKVDGPEYTDEQYEAHLKSDKWTKDETDYLVHLALDFDLRWVVIADRYEYQPKEIVSNGDSMTITLSSKPRTMEDMKARYYEVAAKMMSIQHPLSSMSTAEFDLHEKMTKYDPVRETQRKRLAEALIARSKEEIHEEEILLGELKRIVANEDRFLQERKELYNRLDHPIAQGSITMYESHAGLVQLMQTLLSQDKNKKRRSIIASNEGPSSPAQGPSGQSVPTSARDNRGSIGSASGLKKGSTSAGPQIRQLSARDEVKYGVTHHERLSSGVTFRQARVDKLVLAKSAAQQQKLQDALAQFGVPVKAVMPTAKVCSAYETLVSGIHTLLDVRKVSEKIGNEIKILKAQKELREKRERGEEETPAAEDEGDLDKADGAEENEGEAETEAAADEEGKEEEDVEADGEAEGDGDGDGEEDGSENADNDDAMDEDEDEDEAADADADADEDYRRPEAATKESEDEEEEEEQEDDEEQGVEDEENEEDEEEDEEDEEQEQEGDGGEEDGGEEDGEEEEEEEEESDDEGAMAKAETASVAPSTKSGRLHKRSASVMSVASEKSSKRQRK